MARRVEVRKRREKMARLASALPLASLSTSYQQELRWAIERRCGGKHAFSAPFSCQNDAICQDRLGTSISIETLQKEAFFVRRAERRQDVAKLRAGQVRKRHFLATFYIKISFYQDRLGTNIKTVPFSCRI